MVSSRVLRWLWGLWGLWAAKMREAGCIAGLPDDVRDRPG